MIQERIRLGVALKLPGNWLNTIGADDDDELTAVYDETGILIVTDPAKIRQSLSSFSSSSTRHEAYMASVAEQAAFYETSPIAQWRTEYTGAKGRMSSELEALYLEGEREIMASHLSPLQSDTEIEIEHGFGRQSGFENNE